MRGAVLYGPGDVRFEERRTPVIIEPTDAIVRTSATCVCGSDLWPYRGINPVAQPTPMGHEYCVRHLDLISANGQPFKAELPWSDGKEVSVVVKEGSMANVKAVSKINGKTFDDT